jgi:hypothetical protein
VLRLALTTTKLVEIVGEAAKQVSQPTREAIPSVPSSAAARLRDRLVHDYFDIDLDVLWAAVTDDLPACWICFPTRNSRGSSSFSGADGEASRSGAASQLRLNSAVPADYIVVVLTGTGRTGVMAWRTRRMSQQR